MNDQRHKKMHVPPCRLPPAITSMPGKHTAWSTGSVELGCPSAVSEAFGVG